MKIVPLLILVSLAAVAQTPTLEVSGAGIGNTGAVRYFNPTLGSEGSKIDYADVKGRYFWKDDWQSARVTSKKGKSYWLPQAKLNLYSKEIHYLNEKSEEIVVSNGGIMAIHFLDRADTSKHLAHFQNYVIKGEEFYLELLCKGKTPLLKLVTINLRKGNYDMLLGNYDYAFVSYTDYFVRVGNNSLKLNSLDKKSVSEIVPLTAEDEEWLSTNKNKLKKESDLIAFFTYYNKKEG